MDFSVVRFVLAAMTIMLAYAVTDVMGLETAEPETCVNPSRQLVKGFAIASVVFCTCATLVIGVGLALCLMCVHTGRCICCVLILMVFVAILQFASSIAALVLGIKIAICPSEKIKLK
jgi:hypothetical protein